MPILPGGIGEGGGGGLMRLFFFTGQKKRFLYHDYVRVIHVASAWKANKKQVFLPKILLVFCPNMAT